MLFKIVLKVPHLVNFGLNDFATTTNARRDCEQDLEL